jgi:hypothetical protein
MPIAKRFKGAAELLRLCNIVNGITKNFSIRPLYDFEIDWIFRFFLSFFKKIKIIY